MPKYRAVIVGAGGISGAWFPRLIEEKVDIAAVVDLRIEAARGRIEQYDIDAEASTDLKKTLKRTTPDFVVDLTVPGGGWLLPAVRLSDHASFWDEGYKAVMVTDTAFFRNPHYHRASDTMEKLDFTFMAELVDSLIIFFRSCDLSR